MDYANKDHSSHINSKSLGKGGKIMGSFENNETVLQDLETEINYTKFNMKLR